MGEGVEQENVARSRWKLLAKVLQEIWTSRSNPEASININNSVERTRPQYQSSRLVPTVSEDLYGLFDWQFVTSRRQDEDQDAQYCWIQCRPFRQLDLFSLDIRFPIKHFSFDELTGFNNTGNVCLWPSEEVLAHYCVRHPQLFKDKRVLELGGGMTCLAALAVAATADSGAKLVHCTDGNSISIANVRQILTANPSSFKSPVTTQILDWKSPLKLESVWDVILCADCLFFDDGRDSLVETMAQAVTDNGLVLIMAPRRSGTLETFLKLCKGRFDVHLSQEFDQDVSLAHNEKMLEQNVNHHYNPDQHDPLLIQLRKC